MTKYDWNERLRIMREFDIEGFKRMVEGAAGRIARHGVLVVAEAYEIGLHKARFECVQIEARLREESRQWLEERGLSRQRNLPWPPKGELPT